MENDAPWYLTVLAALYLGGSTLYVHHRLKECGHGWKVDAAAGAMLVIMGANMVFDLGWAGIPMSLIAVALSLYLLVQIVSDRRPS